MKKVITTSILAAILLAVPFQQVAFGQDVSNQVSVSDDTGGRVDPRMDLIEFRAVEPTPFMGDDWEFELMLVSSCGFGATGEGHCTFGVDFDYDGDQVADLILTSTYTFDPKKGGIESATLVDPSTESAICEGAISESVYVVKNHWWGGSLVPFIRLSIGKSCLIQSPTVGLSAWASMKSSESHDLVPNAGFQSFLQPWVQHSPEPNNGSPEEEKAQAPNAETIAGPKFNAGSFKGFVALYAKGYVDHKLSAKVGKDWVIVESIESDFERYVEFTGAGYEINVRMFIDGEFVFSKELKTK